MTKTQWLAELKSWAGAPFKWQGRTKTGVDCWGMVIASAWACDYIPRDFDRKDYSRRTDMVGLANEVLPSFFDNVSRETLEAGDIVLFCHERGPLHMGAVYDHADGGLGIIHADTFSAIVMHQLTEAMAGKITQAYRPRYEP